MDFQLLKEIVETCSVDDIDAGISLVTSLIEQIDQYHSG